MKTKSKAKHAPKRTEFQKVSDRRVIAERYLRGDRQSDIARDLNLSQQQVSYDIRLIHDAWLRDTISNFNILKARELAKVDHLECEAWRAWECELPESNKTETRKRNVKTKRESKESAEARKLIIKLKARDPRYLQIVGDCIDRRRKILGIDAPTKIAPTNPAGDKEYEGLTADERMRRLVAILDAGRARRDRQAARNVQS